MSTTVIYNNSTIGTLDNQTKKLDTAGTWLVDDVTLVDQSSGGEVLVVDTPDSHGGTIREITATNVVQLTTKTITENGTYDAEDDNYDGYSSVTVNIDTQANAVIDYALTKNGTIPNLEWTIPDNLNPTLDIVPVVNNLTIHGSAGTISNNQNLSANIKGVLNFQDLHTIGISCWGYTTPAVTSIYIPNVTSIGANFFQATSVPNLVKIVVGTSPITNTNGSLKGTTALKALVLKGIESVPALNGMNWSTNCGLKTLSDAYIYVPRSLKTSFENTTNWSTFQFRAIEDYPLIDAPDTWLPTEE